MKRLIFSLFLILFFTTPLYAALVSGTNVGFVLVAPTADPGGTAGTLDNYAVANINMTSPADAIEVTEIGWWCNSATQAANFQVGIYNTDDSLVYKSGDAAKGTDAGWKKITGLSIPIVPSTNYHIAVQLDDTSTTTNTDYTDNQGIYREYVIASDLPETWTGDLPANRTMAFYAVYSQGAIVRPVSPDVTTEWTSSGADHYTEIDEAVKNDADYIVSVAEDAPTNFIDEFNMDNSIQGIATASKVVIVIFVSNLGPNQYPDVYGNIKIGSTWQSNVDFNVDTLLSDIGYFTASFSGLSITQAQLDALQVRLQNNSFDFDNSVTISQMWAAVTYTVPEVSTGWVMQIQGDE